MLLGTDEHLVHLVQLVSDHFVLYHHRQAVFAIGHEEALPRIVEGLEDDKASFDGELFTDSRWDLRFKGELAKPAQNGPLLVKPLSEGCKIHSIYRNFH